MTDVRNIECRTIDGHCFVKSDDIVTALRVRAAECREHAETIEPEEIDVSVAWYVAAGDLEERADAFAFADIAHQTEYPGDSPR